jgi:ribosomal protein S18 acetylase RimI-like enzyme
MPTHRSTPVSAVAGVVIRPVGAEEALAVARTHVQADRETYQPIFGAAFREVELDVSQLRWDAALGAGDVLLAAEEAGRMIGFAHASPTWMSALYLLAAHRRRGIGLQLLRALCEALQRRGVTEIGFQAVAENADAIAFYEAVGAKAVGRKREGEGEDTWEDIIFTLATDAPAAFRRR